MRMAAVVFILYDLFSLDGFSCFFDDNSLSAL